MNEKVWSEYCNNAVVMKLIGLPLLALLLGNPVIEASDFRANLEKELDAQVARAEVLLQASRLYEEADRLSEQGKRATGENTGQKEKDPQKHHPGE